VALVWPWWVLGRTHLQRLVGRRRRATRVASASFPDPADDPLPDPTAPLPAVVPFASAEARWTDGAFPPVGGNAVELLVDGREAFPAFHAAIEEAREAIHAVFDIWRADGTGVRLRDALVRAAHRGVSVRVLIDSVGLIMTRPRFFGSLLEAGGEVVRFLPVGTTSPCASAVRSSPTSTPSSGRTGPSRLASRWPPRAPTGPLPGHVTAAVLATGPDRERAHEAVFLAITLARERILLTTPYFLPSPSLLDALRAAVSRGVEVRVIVPRRGDSRLVDLATRASLHLAADAGVRALLHDGMAHAKALVVDDRLSAVGSANVDSRSFRLSFELTCVFGSLELAARLASVFGADAGRSTAWLRPPRSKAGEVLESAAHLMSPLL
jgi:cardiolipin synthase